MDKNISTHDNYTNRIWCNILTLEDKNRIHRQLEFLSQIVFKDHNEWIRGLSEEVDLWLGQLIADWLKQNNANMHQLVKLLSLWQNQVEQMEELKVVVARPLTSKIVFETINKIKTDWRKDVVVDFEVDNSIMAGIQVVYGGDIWDYSLNKMWVDAGMVV